MFKRALSSLACLSVVCVASISLAHPKIDLFLDVPDGGVEAKALSISVVPPIEVEVFIKAYDTGSVSSLVHELGGRVGVISGSIITASVPKSALGEIADFDDVVFIEAAKPVSFSNDVATAEVGSSEANEGVGLPESYTGEGVIIGVIDTGIDYAHSDFADADGNSRVLSIWDQSKTSGTPPPRYRTDMARSAIMNRSVPTPARSWTSRATAPTWPASWRATTPHTVAWRRTPIS